MRSSAGSRSTASSRATAGGSSPASCWCSAAIGGWIWWQNSQQAAGRRAGRGPARRARRDRERQPQRRPAEDRRARRERHRGLSRRRLVRARQQRRSRPATCPPPSRPARIADDEDLDEPYRQAALIRQTALEFDRLQPQVVIQRLGPLAGPGSAWFGTAGEMVGVAHLKMSRPDLAGPIFARIGRDETVPPSIRTRAIQMAGSSRCQRARAEQRRAPASRPLRPLRPQRREKAE